MQNGKIAQICAKYIEIKLSRKILKFKYYATFLLHEYTVKKSFEVYDPSTRIKIVFEVENFRIKIIVFQRKLIIYIISFSLRFCTSLYVILNLESGKFFILMLFSELLGFPFVETKTPVILA